MAGHVMVLRDDECPCPAKLSSRVAEISSEETYRSLSDLVAAIDKACEEQVTDAKSLEW